MSSAEPRAESGRPSLRAIARTAVEHGVRTGHELDVDPAEHPPELRKPGASFVTLRRSGELRGCTGTLEATDPLVIDVARNAYRSAFHDPRFRPLTRPELEDLDVSVSVLGPLEPLPAASEQDLLAALRPGRDGLVIHEGPRRATFLPAVWQSLPDPREFLDALRQKAGLPDGYWSATLRFERYFTEDAP